MLVIQIKNVYKIYKVGVEKIHALDGVDLNIEPNEYVAIMGPSGSGKSTLMNLIGCLDCATRGDYFLNGENVSLLGSSALARIRNDQIGFVFQTFELLPRQSALKNVELPLLYSTNSHWFSKRKIAKKALARVGLAQRAKHRPNQMSGGERQRVAIARALIRNPGILMADEPTGNLDSRTGVEIMKLFDDLHAQGQTIIMVTHEEDIANHAQRIVRMKDGKIISDEQNHRYTAPADSPLTTEGPQ